MEFYQFALACVLCFVLGMFGGIAAYKRSRIRGVLSIDVSHYDKPAMFIDFTSNPKTMAGLKTVVLVVDPTADLRPKFDIRDESQ